MLMSPWNLLAAFEHNNPSPGGPGDPLAPPGPFVPFWGRVTVSQFTFEPMDLALRAMCHHHLGQPKEAEAYLRRTRDLLGKAGGSVEQRALLREAETLIEGKARP